MITFILIFQLFTISQAFLLYPCEITSLLFHRWDRPIWMGCNFHRPSALTHSVKYQYDSNLMKTSDAGRSWEIIYSADEVFSSLIWTEWTADATTKRLIGIGGRVKKDVEYYLYHSQNGGQQWKDITPLITPLDRGVYKHLRMDETGQYVSVLKNDYREQFLGELFLSNDFGTSWQWVHNLPDIYDSQIHTINGSIPMFYAMTMQGLYRTTTFGQSWTWLHPMTPSAMSVDYTGTTLWLMNYHSIFFSTDSGHSWLNRTIPNTKQFHPTFHSSPTHPHHATVTFFDGANLTFHIYHTDTGGRNWTIQSILPVYYFMQPPLVAMEIDSISPDILIALPDYPLLHSADNGKTFQTFFLSHSRLQLLASKGMKSRTADWLYGNGVDEYHAREHDKATRAIYAQDVTQQYILMVMQYYDDAVMRYWYYSVDSGKSFHPIALPIIPNQPGYVSKVSKLDILAVNTSCIVSNDCEINISVRVQMDRKKVFHIQFSVQSSVQEDQNSVKSVDSIEWIEEMNPKFEEEHDDEDEDENIDGW